MRPQGSEPNDGPTGAAFPLRAQAALSQQPGLAELHPDQFGNKQHSIVQRLLRALRKSTAQRFLVETAAEGIRERRAAPGAVDGSGYAGPDPTTAPLSVPVLNADPSANVLRPPAW
jgi:hypothetical protein